jgi:hypothetical protein
MQTIRYRAAEVNRLKISYREAGRTPRKTDVLRFTDESEPEKERSRFSFFVCDDGSASVALSGPDGELAWRDSHRESCCTNGGLGRGSCQGRKACRVIFHMTLPEKDPPT